MIKMIKVVGLKPLDGYRLWIRFSDGSEGIRDYADMIAEGGPMVEPLRDQQFFSKVFLSMGIPTWPNGYDVDAVALHMELERAGLLSSGVAA
ncbi:MAG: DUF2442 domain-containing protein [Aestuariivirga sp.]